MPGTTRYSATFDRPYEEEDRISEQTHPNARRSRSLSLQATSSFDGRPYAPPGVRPPNQRSSSTDNGPSKGSEHIPTRTVAKTPVKAHNNPFQFVKVGTCPLYKKAEEQIKKAKEIKKPDVLKEEEEEWQSNLDSWKSRRRKMSEDVIRRQEEIKQLELEEQISQLTQKKTKTFSEMVESRANRGRTLSLCLLTSPLELQNWEIENGKNSSNSTFSGESEENSTVNSEDEGVSFKGSLEKSQNGTRKINRTNGETHNGKNCLKLEAHNGDYHKLTELSNNIKSKDGVYIDSGLESISSSHRAGDTPDSGSDFSQDSGSSIECESPRTGVNLLDDFSSKHVQLTPDREIAIKVCLDERGQDFGFTFHIGKNEDQVIISSILEGSKAESAGICLGDQIITIDSKYLTFLKHRDITSLIQKAKDKGEIKLLLWRRGKSIENSSRNGHSVDKKTSEVSNISSNSENHNGVNELSNSLKQEKSIESENEMYVDDFEELKRQSQLESSNEEPERNTNAQGVYALNVPSASLVTKKEKSVTSLFPLSPVTELPSPVDGNKTIASSLSENISASPEKNKIFSTNVIKQVEYKIPLNKKENNSSVNPVEKNKHETKCNGTISTPNQEAVKVTRPLSLAINNNQNNSLTEIPKDEKPKPNLIKRKVKVKKEKNNSSLCTAEQVSPTKSSTVPVSPTRNDITNAKCDTKKEISNLSYVTPAKIKCPVSDSLNDAKKLPKDDDGAKITFSVSENANINKLQNVSCTTTSQNNLENNSNTVDQKNESETSTNVATAEDLKKSLVDSQDEKLKETVPKKTKVKAKKKNTNCQKSNVPAKVNEDFKNDSLNIIFQSEPKNVNCQNESSDSKNSKIESSTKSPSIDLAPDILPVEKIAEEMEKLILEQLEEEERAKELVVEQVKSTVESPDHLLTAPPKCAEPPKEKPPPPPAVTPDENQKDPSLKRVNSTKRIKKEIHKRRSNFLGIENADENIVCSEPSIPPPPALEEILKAEMELDRQSRLQIESASSERLSIEEKELMLKEREIIESLESEERQKQLITTTEDLIFVPSNTDSTTEDRIQMLKNERKLLGINEEQYLIPSEEKLLKEREEFIRQQEDNTTVLLSESSLSIAENKTNTSVSSLSPFSADNQSLSGANGDGKSLTSTSISELSEASKPSNGDKNKSEKPAVPPKPMKKKEAIRRERERLRQEQEALQREREEHRRKLILEQEDSLKNQKSHAPDVPASLLGPFPPIAQSTFPSQLTPPSGILPNTRENATLPGWSHHGAVTAAVRNNDTAELMAPAIIRQSRVPSSRGKTVQNEPWGQQKMPPSRKQNQDCLPESRYNQNHWLIQEAEMRRIAELKEKQRASQLPVSQAHLAEDDVCSNTSRMSVPVHNQHMNHADVWNYGQNNMPIKKYPPPIIKDQLHTVYPREPVSQQPPAKPSRVVPIERPEQMLSVSGRKRCSHCNEELGRGAAMIIESLQLYYHIHCFQCCVCQAQLGNGSCGTDVRVRNNKLHCHNCYSNDEAGLKFSQV